MKISQEDKIIQIIFFHMCEVEENKSHFLMSFVFLLTYPLKLIGVYFFFFFADNKIGF